MIQISIVSGKNSGKKFDLNHFPVIIGRDSKADVILDDDGVWDRHCQISYTSDGFYLSSIEPATVILNEKVVQKKRLTNGDLVVIGDARFRFWLSEVKPKNFITREALMWVAIIALFFVQVLIIYEIIQVTG
ncbi:MAG: FHA domain-containing protein [Verrucomicrobiae bacterium]|nr:FHA domain-containing protein [Verrucomicrobiae bacterium]